MPNKNNNQVLVQGAKNALDGLKHQVASQIGVTPPASGYWGDMSARQCGAVGGNMVKAMIQMAEAQIAGGAGFTGNIGGAGRPGGGNTR
ncbi:MAG: small, acid-soluble spore protein, alpha/beta type [bacterium]|jgi:small acid-soluble spore protein A (major alpha-type SASP)